MSGSMRTRLQEAMAQLDGKYRAALKDSLMQDAFDELWPAWSVEMGAMINSEVLSSLDLLLLTAAVDNRRLLMELRARLEEPGRGDR
ncbi:hypothetical protein A3K81_04900 [Candidatus Bathyarchaeota archaeon RBG_13_60_20]|jgi:hypothetical protein|nr:MAG: hypothetical protein A3K81_04900 [Candidatus Bathyarchaeota archaeon RBG_13_60_20]